jgi:uncharacterized protein YjbJ (UPF0337 family)
MSHGCCSTGIRFTPLPGRRNRRNVSVLLIRERGDRINRRKKEIPMGLDDKIENKGEDLKGKAKEATGKATDDDELETEGKTDQAKSSLKDAKENVKDAFS